MNLTWLDDVLILLEEGNMTRAAERRNITQPAFSRRIKSFEDWVGTTVLERHSNRVEISAALAGNEAEIQALAARLKSLRDKISRFDPSRSTVTMAVQHAPVFSIFPDVALEARAQFPGLTFRLRPGNWHACVAMFMRGDASVLLCYESPLTDKPPFSNTVKRTVWGTDMLIPVVGGRMRFSVQKDGQIPEDTPALIYPEDSYFGEVLAKSEMTFGTRAFTLNPICETAFTAGTKEMALSGLGVGWVPLSMCYKEIERGDMLSLATQFGQVPLEATLYANLQHDVTRPLVDLWAARAR